MSTNANSVLKFELEVSFGHCCSMSWKLWNISVTDYLLNDFSALTVS